MMWCFICGYDPGIDEKRFEGMTTLEYNLLPGELLDVVDALHLQYDSAHYPNWSDD